MDAIELPLLTSCITQAITYNIPITNTLLGLQKIQLLSYELLANHDQADQKEEDDYQDIYIDNLPLTIEAQSSRLIKLSYIPQAITNGIKDYILTIHTDVYGILYYKLSLQAIANKIIKRTLQFQTTLGQSIIKKTFKIYFIYY